MPLPTRATTLACLLALLAACPSHSTIEPIVAAEPDSARPPTATPLPSSGLDALVARAEASRSSALLVSQRGELLVERYWETDAETPLYVMSVSKSVVGLAVMMLVERGVLGLDTTLGELVDGLDPDVATITVDELLTHTSGLPTARVPVDAELLPALRAMRVDGSARGRFVYNNTGVDVLGIVVARALARAEAPEDGLFAWMQAHLHRPLGIRHAQVDRFADGFERAAGELRYRPRDLLAIGQLVLAGGVTPTGERLVREETLHAMVDRPAGGGFHGRLWWTYGPDRIGVTGDSVTTAREADLDPALCDALAAVEGQQFDSFLDAYAALVVHGAPIEQMAAFDRQDPFRFFSVGPGPTAYHEAQGYLGQYLIIVPDAEVVAVRLIAMDRAVEVERGRSETEHARFGREIAQLAEAWPARAEGTFEDQLRARVEAMTRLPE